MLVSKASAEGCVGSSPTWGTMKDMKYYFNHRLNDNGDDLKKEWSQLAIDLNNDQIITESDLNVRWEKLIDTVPLGWLINTYSIEMAIKKRFPDFFEKRWEKIFRKS